jgi:hypothetical protein
MIINPGTLVMREPGAMACERARRHAHTPSSAVQVETEISVKAKNACQGWLEKLRNGRVALEDSGEARFNRDSDPQVGTRIFQDRQRGSCQYAIA